MSFSKFIFFKMFNISLTDHRGILDKRLGKEKNKDYLYIVHTPHVKTIYEIAHSKNGYVFNNSLCYRNLNDEEFFENLEHLHDHYDKCVFSFFSDSFLMESIDLNEEQLESVDKEKPWTGIDNILKGKYDRNRIFCPVLSDRNYVYTSVDKNEYNTIKNKIEEIGYNLLRRSNLIYDIIQLVNESNSIGCDIVLINVDEFYAALVINDDSIKKVSMFNGVGEQKEARFEKSLKRWNDMSLREGGTGRFKIITNNKNNHLFKLIPSWEKNYKLSFELLDIFEEFLDYERSN